MHVFENVGSRETEIRRKLNDNIPEIYVKQTRNLNQRIFYLKVQRNAKKSGETIQQMLDNQNQAHLIATQTLKDLHSITRQVYYGRLDAVFH